MKLSTSFFKRFLDQVENVHTRRAYARYLQLHPLNLYSPGDLSRAIENLSQANRRVAIAAFRSFGKWALNRGILDWNYARLLVSIPSSPARIERRLTRDLVEKMLAASDDLEHATIKVLYLLGVRCGELTTGRLEGSVLKIRSKGGVERSINVSGLESDLRLVLGAPYRTLYMRVKRIADRCDQPSVSPHWFRHGFATHLREDGIPIEKISQMLGHTNLGSTQVYLHFCFYSGFQLQPVVTF